MTRGFSLIVDVTCDGKQGLFGGGRGGGRGMSLCRCRAFGSLEGERAAVATDSSSSGGRVSNAAGAGIISFCSYESIFFFFCVCVGVKNEIEKSHPLLEV